MKKILAVLFILIEFAQCAQPKLSKESKVYFEYCYWQKIASREAGFGVDEANMNYNQKYQYELGCAEKFNKIWPNYDGNIKTKYKLDDKSFSDIISKGLQDEASDPNRAIGKLTESELLIIINQN